MKKILVVVDMQNDFIDGPLGTPEARAIVDNVVDKIRGDEWDEVYFTLDTHSEDYLDTQEGKKLPIKHGIPNTDGFKLNDKIGMAINERPFGAISLCKNAFGSTILVKRIRDLVQLYWKDNVFLGDIGRGVQGYGFELTLVGVCTDICVISNALLLKAHYPEMKIVVDASCCAGSSPEKHFMALEVMKSCHIDVINNEYDRMKENALQLLSKAYGVPIDIIYPESES